MISLCRPNLKSVRCKKEVDNHALNANLKPRAVAKGLDIQTSGVHEVLNGVSKKDEVIHTLGQAGKKFALNSANRLDL